MQQMSSPPQQSSTPLTSIPPVKTVVCIGAGFVGGPTMAVLAKYCPEVNVYVVDICQSRIDAWNSDNLPLYEPGLKEIVQRQLGVNLFFTTNIADSIRQADVVFIAVNTPTKEFGSMEGYDLSAYESATISVANYAARSHMIVVEKSTVPVRTAERMRAVLESNKKHDYVKFEVISNPEFLAEGTAINDLENPDRILIGGRDNSDGSRAVKTLMWLYKHWVPETKIITTGLWSAELGKLAANAFLAQRVSSINSISALCEAAGADVREISKVLGADRRIGSKFLNASIGFGGSCFAKDLRGLIYLCECYSLPVVADYWRQVLRMNDFQKERFCNTVLEKMFGTVKGKKIAILGFAFKKDTSDFRESAAISISKTLLAEGAKVCVYDPQVKATQVAIEVSPDIRFEQDAMSATANAHGVLILTEWEQFLELDWPQIYTNMNKPAFVFDGRNLLNDKMLASIGFQVYSIGKPFNGYDYKRL